jgi:alpha-tubulin suppressor-like RCC1 family protein
MPKPGRTSSSLRWGSERFGPLTRLYASGLAISLMAAIGCRDEAESPTAPETAPALATAATTTLVFRQVSSGAVGHTCGVTTDNRAYCWGSNFYGQLGIGTATGPETCSERPCSTRPVAVAGGLRFQHVSAGFDFTCGITTDHRAYCWGRGSEGQLGDGTRTQRLTPTPVAGTRHFRQVRAAATHACGITTFDGAFCWGDNVSGQLGDGTRTERLAPVRVFGGLQWRQLSAGTSHTCGVTAADRAYCWGSDAVGDGTTKARLKPAAVSGGLHFRQVDAGHSHTCGVTTTDQAYCWGSSNQGALGDGKLVSFRTTPTAVVGALRRFDHVDAGYNHTCGVTRFGRGFCWGANLVGQLGDGTTTSRIKPFALGVDLSLARVSAGYGVSCGVTTGGQAYCWGVNDSGQLGDGTTTSRLLPVAVVGPT